MIDTKTPLMGPFRLPNENERRTRLMFCHPYKDCVDVCEMNPDLEEKTDATMRLFAASPKLLAACQMAKAGLEQMGSDWSDEALRVINEAIAATGI